MNCFCLDNRYIIVSRLNEREIVFNLDTLIRYRQQANTSSGRGRTKNEFSGKFGTPYTVVRAHLSASSAAIGCLAGSAAHRHLLAAVLRPGITCFRAPLLMRFSRRVRAPLLFPPQKRFHPKNKCYFQGGFFFHRRRTCDRAPGENQLCSSPPHFRTVPRPRYERKNEKLSVAKSRSKAGSVPPTVPHDLSCMIIIIKLST